jgi:hypothetical protein
MEITRAGGALGIPGLYVTGDPGASDEAAKQGSLSLRLGLGWAKSHAFYTGQCPVMRYNRQLMMAILHDRVHIADNVNVNATSIPLDQAPRGYAAFDQGAARLDGASAPLPLQAARTISVAVEEPGSGEPAERDPASLATAYLLGETHWSR